MSALQSALGLKAVGYALRRGRCDRQPDRRQQGACDHRLRGATWGSSASRWFYSNGSSPARPNSRSPEADQVTNEPLVLIPACCATSGCGNIRSNTCRHRRRFGRQHAGGRLNGMARRILEDAPPRFALAGLSMGGYVAQEIAAPRNSPSARADTPRRSDAARADRTCDQGQVQGHAAAVAAVDSSRPAGGPDPDQHDHGHGEKVGQEVFVRQQNTIMGRIDGRRTSPRSPFRRSSAAARTR